MEPKVVFVVVDGVRGQEIDVPGVLPNLQSLARRSLWLPRMEVSNPVGISLPAYADILAGRRQPAVMSNSRPAREALATTILHHVRTGLGLDENGVALISSWGAMEWLCEDGFYKNCGWRLGMLKPEVYPGSRADVDTARIFFRELDSRKPRFVFVHLGDADEEGHLHEQGDIFHYHHALRESDHHLGQMKAFLEDHPFYRDSTYFIVTTDHGRDLEAWWDHGLCVTNGKDLCGGCRNVFGVISGPGIRPQVSTSLYRHVDWAPTIAALFGLSMPTALGQPIAEAIPV